MISRVIAKGSAAILAYIFVGVATASAVTVTFEIADPEEFNRIIDTSAVLTTPATINTWLEGPTWVRSKGGGGYLVFCDQNNNRLKKLVLPDTVTDFLLPPANTLFNSTLLDGQEHLICAEAGSAGQKISMVTDGVVTPLVTACNGLKFYSPNDVAVKSDGTIWFTDPKLQQRHSQRNARICGWLLRLSIRSRQRQCHVHGSHDEQLWTHKRQWPPERPLFLAR